MFKHLFASMNEMLDEVAVQWGTASSSKKTELQDKLHTLKGMSDTFIEEWLQFEEKMAAVYQQTNSDKEAGETPIVDELDPELDGKRSDGFLKGQGFYKLLMYDEAIREFSVLVDKQPEFTLARIYLAMSFLHKGEMTECYSQFHFLSQLTDNTQMKAISFNVLGCIQIWHRNMEKALEYFSLAYRADPYSVEPLVDMGVCSEAKGKLRFTHDPARK